MSLTYEEVERKAWEANIYHRVGYVVIFKRLEQTDRGYKGEEREASEAEIDMFDIIKNMTPAIKTVTVDDSVDLWFGVSNLSELIKKYIYETDKLSFIGGKVLMDGE